MGATFTLAVMTFAQGILGGTGGTGDSAPVAGAFHALNAFLILGLSLLLTWPARRGRLLVPSSQLPAEAKPQEGQAGW